MKTGTSATAATAAVARRSAALGDSPSTTWAFVRAVQRIEPDGDQEGQEQGEKRQNWSGRISLRTGSVESSRQGSQGCPSQPGPLSR